MGGAQTNKLRATRNMGGAAGVRHAARAIWVTRNPHSAYQTFTAPLPAFEEDCSACYRAIGLRLFFDSAQAFAIAIYPRFHPCLADTKSATNPTFILRNLAQPTRFTNQRANISGSTALPDFCNRHFQRTHGLFLRHYKHLIAMIAGQKYHHKAKKHGKNHHWKGPSRRRGDSDTARLLQAHQSANTQ